MEEDKKKELDDTIDKELENLRYKNCTANVSFQSRNNLYIFTDENCG